MEHFKFTADKLLRTLGACGLDADILQTDADRIRPHICNIRKITEYIIAA